MGDINIHDKEVIFKDVEVGSEAERIYGSFNVKYTGHADWNERIRTPRVLVAFKCELESTNFYALGPKIVTAEFIKDYQTDWRIEKIRIKFSHGHNDNENSYWLDWQCSRDDEIYLKCLEVVKKNWTEAIQKMLHRAALETQLKWQKYNAQDRQKYVDKYKDTAQEFEKAIHEFDNPTIVEPDPVLHGKPLHFNEEFYPTENNEDTDDE